MRARTKKVKIIHRSKSLTNKSNSALICPCVVHIYYTLFSFPSLTQGGILAIVGLIGVDGGNATRTSRFANYLRNMLPCNDVSVMEMVAKAVGRLAQVGGTFSADYVEFEVKKALEWLSGGYSSTFLD